MTIIGTFIKTCNGFSGTVRTLTLNSKISFVACEKDSERAPDFRIWVGGLDIGAAWQKVSAAERDYLSCKLDDPSFAAPLYASLVASDDGEIFSLIWSR